MTLTTPVPRRRRAAGHRLAPAFELKDASGATHRLEEFRGNAVVIHFWAGWCPPCLDEIPRWVELANSFRGRKLKLVAISLDRSWEDASKVLPSGTLPASIVSLLDTTKKLPDLYGTYQYPETYLLDADLKIVAKWVGGQDWASAAILAQIEKAIPSQ